VKDLCIIAVHIDALDDTYLNKTPVTPTIKNRQTLSNSVCILYGKNINEF
jgi:hypothetical protein